ncbi:cytochrome P450 [Cyathus striatus]|nr:cytochrome P450 [Cyathus striatus]
MHSNVHRRLLRLFQAQLHSYLPTPPGPRKLPIIGNLLDMPMKESSKTYEEMGRKYKTDILNLNVLGMNIVVVNSFDTALELLDKRSKIYSSRARVVMLDLSNYSYLLSIIPYNSIWRAQRRLFNKYFHPTNTAIHEPRAVEHTHVLLGKLLERPEAFLSHIRHMIASISLSMVYGLKIKAEDDPYVELAERALETMNEMITPGAFLVEVFPMLAHIPEWVPGAGFHRVVKKGQIESEEMLNVPFNASLAAMRDGTIFPSFISEGMLDPSLPQDVDRAQHQRTLQEISVMTYLAAVDTTTGSLGIFILAMMKYPEVQKTAQRELDEVLQGRLPEYSDKSSIPYITALLREVLRWEPVVPAGIPHYNTEDDIFNGYYIPKGTIIIPNQKAMLHDEHEYPDPHVFKPERFLKDGRLNEEIRNPEDIAFGFGRRKCPGRHIALSTLWLSIASILSTFNIEKPVDENGNIVEPTYEIVDGGLIHAKPFSCSLKPRSDEAASLIRSCDT